MIEMGCYENYSCFNVVSCMTSFTCYVVCRHFSSQIVISSNIWMFPGFSRHQMKTFALKWGFVCPLLLLSHLAYQFEYLFAARKRAHCLNLEVLILNLDLLNKVSYCRLGFSLICLLCFFFASVSWFYSSQLFQPICYSWYCSLKRCLGVSFLLNHKGRSVRRSKPVIAIASRCYGSSVLIRTLSFFSLQLYIFFHQQVCRSIVLRWLVGCHRSLFFRS